MSFCVAEEDLGSRLDVFCQKHLSKVSRSRVQNWLRIANQKPSRILKQIGEKIELCPPSVTPSTLEAQNIPLEVLFADEDLIVINKPAGMVVHPGAGNPDKTLVNALLYHYPGLCVGDTERPGIVHRLDKDTSGILLIARNNESHQALSEAFKNRTIQKTYRAICQGNLKKDSFELITGHKRHPTNRKRFTTQETTTRIAHSRYTVLKRKNGTTEVQVDLLTGRTHQIRAQLADIGHPLLGDRLYGGPLIPGFHRQALHAERIVFSHPRSEAKMDFQVAPDFSTIDRRIL
ncbi:MAG: RluA family pseudouridine synthase [Myxococcaceae bacterium]|nr:RluA family pseudouridine synthase [Myxococcaceae bacterium]MBH2006335.1 RluA family pseudouridine synthase [Myxococcaceae bacterium]